MTAILKNFIGGEWVDGSGVTKNINPSNTNDVVGEYAKADKAQTEKAIAAAKAAFPAWAQSTPQVRYDALNKISLEILARKEELGRLLAREEGKTLPEGIGEVARAGQIFAFFAGEALRLIGEKGASVRPGLDVELTREPVGVVGMITPWNFPIAIPAWKIAPGALLRQHRGVQAGRAGAGLGACAVRDHHPLRHSGRRVQPRGRLAAPSSARRCSTHPDVAAISFTGSVQTGRKIAQACVLSNPMKKFQLEMGGKNPLVVLDDADLKTAVEVAVNGAYLLDRPALHRLLAPDRHRRHPRPLRRGGGRAPEGPVGGRRAQGRRAYRPGRRPEPARPGPALHQDRPGRGRQARLRRRAAQARDARPSTSSRRCSPRPTTTCASRARRSSARSPPSSAPRTTRKRWRSPTTPSSASPPASARRSLKYASHFKRNSEAGMVMVNLPTAGVDYHVPFGGRKGSSYGAARAGLLCARVLHHGEDRLYLSGLIGHDRRVG